MVPAEAQIGIVTGETGASADERALAHALTVRGHSVETVSWRTATWERFDAAAFGSCLGYDDAPEAFVDRVEAARAAGVTLLNPPAAVTWNVHRVYLRDLADAGVPVVETAFLQRGTDRSLRSVFAERDWETAVVKPAVGVGASGVWRVRRSEADRVTDRFQSRVAESDQLVQRFHPGIADGELSVVSFSGRVSHAFRTVPADGGFRARPDFGATTVPTDPDSRAVALAEEALRAVREVTGVDRHLPYARVDLVPVDADGDESRTDDGRQTDGQRHDDDRRRTDGQRRTDGERRAVESSDFRVLDVSVIAPYLGTAWADTADRLADAVLAGMDGGAVAEVESAD